MLSSQMMKESLESRRENVLSINNLLKDFKEEGELTSGVFPQGVSEKIAQLNVDWQIIIRLALALKERPVVEDVVVAEAIQTHEAPTGSLGFNIDDFKLDSFKIDEFKADSK